MRKIALFNHKGGVSKTTTVFNLGWMLAEQGKTVLMVDSDPQCNLTGMTLGFKGADDLENFYTTESQHTIRSGLVPAFEAQPREIRAVEPVRVDARPGLFLMAGDLRLSEYEVTLGIAQELSAAIGALQNLPGSLDFLIRRTAEAVEADYVLIDMSPGLGSVNQNLVSISDYLLLPTSPDVFSVMAIDSLARVLPRWRKWALEASKIAVLQEAAYPFEPPDTKVLGAIVQRFRPRGGGPAAAFQKWVDELNVAIVERLRPSLSELGMLLPAEAYATIGVEEHNSIILAIIAEFNSLISRSQEYATPVFALSDAQLEATGPVLENQQNSRDRFHATFSELASRTDQLAEFAEREKIANS